MISLIIPTYNAGPKFKKLLENIKFHQSLKPDEIIVIDSESQDDTVKIAEEMGCKVLKISKRDFNHGKTRTIAGKKAKGDILVYLTQDVYPYNEKSLENLVKAFKEDERIGAVFGRQIAPEDLDIFASFFRHFNYPERSYVRSLTDCKKFGRKTVFFSNSFSAYRRDVLERVGWFKEVISYEDIYIAGKILKAGYLIKYVSDAIVWHGHSWRLKGDFKRHFILGRFFAREKWILEEFGRKPKDEGLRMIKEFIKFSNGRPDLVLAFLLIYFLRKLSFATGYIFEKWRG